MNEIYEEVYVRMVQQKVAARHRLPLELQILRFLSEVGYATEGQIVQLFERRYAAATVETEIRKMFRAEKLSRFLTEPPKHLKIDLGKMKTIFATEKGRTRLLTVDKEAGVFGRFGKLEGENTKRVLHELLAAESYVWFVRQGFEVIWFVHENQLKKRLGRRRWERIRQNYPI